MDHRTKYESEGVVCPLRVLSDERTKTCRDGFSNLERRHNGRVTRAGWTHLFFDWAFDLISEPRILDIVEEILGSDILVQSSLILRKYPHSRGFIPWHQDGHYSNLPAWQSVSAWVALTRSTPENGCMRVIPRTHTNDYLAHSEITDEDSMVTNGGEISHGFDESDARDLVLDPGEMSIHHNLIVHGSMPNNSPHQRIGFIIRYTTPAYEGVRPVIRVRGTSDCSHLSLAGRPTPLSDAERYTAYIDFLTRQGDHLGDASELQSTSKA